MTPWRTRIDNFARRSPELFVLVGLAAMLSAAAALVALALLLSMA